TGVHPGHDQLLGAGDRHGGRHGVGTGPSQAPRPVDRGERVFRFVPSRHGVDSTSPQISRELEFSLDKTLPLEYLPHKPLRETEPRRWPDRLPGLDAPDPPFAPVAVAA